MLWVVESVLAGFLVFEGWVVLNGRVVFEGWDVVGNRLVVLTHLSCWCSFLPPSGGSAHWWNWSEKTYSGHVQIRKQAKEQVFFSLGSGHHLQEEAGTPKHQSGRFQHRRKQQAQVASMAPSLGDMCACVCAPLLTPSVVSDQLDDTKLVVLDPFNRESIPITLNSAISLSPHSRLPPASFPNAG